jgi:hypothetical protein
VVKWGSFREDAVCWTCDALADRFDYLLAMRIIEGLPQAGKKRAKLCSKTHALRSAAALVINKRMQPSRPVKQQGCGSLNVVDHLLHWWSWNKLWAPVRTCISHAEEPDQTHRDLKILDWRSAT